jgi:hypothetical protein
MLLYVFMLYLLKATKLPVNCKGKPNTAIQHSSAYSVLTTLNSTVDKLVCSTAEVIANITAMWLQAVSSTVLRVEQFCVHPVRRLSFLNPALCHIASTLCVCACVCVL